MIEEDSIQQDPGGGQMFMKASRFYTVTEEGLRCRICPNNCLLRDGIRGLCRTHVALNGKLFTVAYGNPCSVHTDPIEKKPLFHFLPSSDCLSIATAGCNLACKNCQNWEISQCSPDHLRNHDFSPEKVVESALSSRSLSIAYTYTEPTVFYEYMYDTAVIARNSGLKNLMISNGYISEEPLRALAGFLDAANIDLKSFSAETYKKIFRGELKPVLRSLRILKESGVWLEITNLLIPGLTDQADEIKAMCEWLAANGFSDTPLHFSRFHPMYRLGHIPVTPVQTLEKARETALGAGIRFVYIGNVPGSDAEDTFCPSCARAVIGRRGFTVTGYHIRHGACGYCGTHIPGVWAAT